MPARACTAAYSPAIKNIIWLPNCEPPNPQAGHVPKATHCTDDGARKPAIFGRVLLHKERVFAIPIQHVPDEVVWAPGLTAHWQEAAPASWFADRILRLCCHNTRKAEVCGLPKWHHLKRLEQLQRVGFQERQHIRVISCSIVEARQRDSHQVSYDVCS